MSDDCKTLATFQLDSEDGVEGYEVSVSKHGEGEEVMYSLDIFSNFGAASSSTSVMLFSLEDLKELGKTIQHAIDQEENSAALAVRKLNNQAN